MGEYAIDQMVRDHQRMFGYTPERCDFESEARTMKKPVCPKCGKKFRAHIAVRDHMRDKHSAKPATVENSNANPLSAGDTITDAWRSGAEVQYLVTTGHDDEWTDYTASAPPDTSSRRLAWRVKPSTAGDAGSKS